jgi:hypothetical protein
MLWTNQPISVAFAGDGKSLYVADDAGRLTKLNETGEEAWHTDVACNAALGAQGDNVFAAGWDGMLRSFDGATGKPRWTLDLTPALEADTADPMAAIAKLPHGSLHVATRPSTTIAEVPSGENMLKNGKATLALGGTAGWMSNGALLIKPEQLTNGATDDGGETPWLHIDEVFWDAITGRQVFAEITFKEPTDVTSVTVHENPKHENSWPTEGLVQVWDEPNKKWVTAGRGVFMSGPVNTYSVNLKGVTKLRYVPWNSYYRNFYTNEIEVR